MNSAKTALHSHKQTIPKSTKLALANPEGMKESPLLYGKVL
jgi:hypothetical protein